MVLGQSPEEHHGCILAQSAVQTAYDLGVADEFDRDRGDRVGDVEPMEGDGSGREGSEHQVVHLVDVGEGGGDRCRLGKGDRESRVVPPISAATS